MRRCRQSLKEQKTESSPAQAEATSHLFAAATNPAAASQTASSPTWICSLIRAHTKPAQEGRKRRKSMLDSGHRRFDSGSPLCLCASVVQLHFGFQISDLFRLPRRSQTQAGVSNFEFRIFPSHTPHTPARSETERTRSTHPSVPKSRPPTPRAADAKQTSLRQSRCAIATRSTPETRQTATHCWPHEAEHW